MALDYVAFQKIAKGLIEANGRSVTLKKRARTAADSSKPWDGPGTNPDTTLGVLTAVFIPFTDNDVFGELIRRGDEKAYIAHTSLAVDLKDTDIIEDGSTVWKVQNVTIINPGDLSILYEMHVRR